MVDYRIVADDCRWGIGNIDMKGNYGIVNYKNAKVYKTLRGAFEARDRMLKLISNLNNLSKISLIIQIEEVEEVENAKQYN